MTVAGKVALVTGASEGIGYAIAETLVAAGAHVVLTARREGPLAAAAGKLGPSAAWIAGDMAEADTAERAVEHTVGLHGGLDLLVCNAGILIPGALAEQPMSEADRVIAVNLRATIAMMQAAVPAMAARPDASAVVISSSIGRLPTAGMGVYGATKAALHYLVPTWAIELAPQDIRVNAVCAGITETPGLQVGAQHIPGLRQAVVATNLIKRIATADEIAKPVVTLLDSAVSGYVTGSVWDIDGGFQRDRSGAAQAPETVRDGTSHGAA
ncbi:SDR family oxidoreductase [Streptomyces sp. ISL-98]|uniref:SDR family NAD(P)-dependent oxidoreductase n=1 Tax=Streptomyces sp. ISL-98 TaxID=2819192 RepID=UPI001BE605E2|nr:SDR family oxidoreductase [Streptomyces sp. ISL-98]MBT2510553.1 SDR family oxidoreductase [Streptomyces sp. ISL-98]